MKFKRKLLNVFQCYAAIICVLWRSWWLLKNVRHLSDFTEDSTEGRTCIFENLITMVWILVEAHSAVPGTHILVAVVQLCSLWPQPVFQLSEASPSLVLLPWGRKKVISWLSSHQLIVADQKARAFPVSHVGTLQHWRNTGINFLPYYFLLSFSSMQHSASTGNRLQKILSEINNTRDS